MNEKKHDILVCISEFNSIDLDKSRKGIVNTLIKAGEVLNKTQEAVAVMPGGSIIIAVFMGGGKNITYLLFLSSLL
ncbi:hypothetical protein [Escherichia coli]|uniref:hypothetical protein n=1 Tax=Escherichia coli TaxID=562 RepID=UPI0020243FD8|nr:hypothetical protein [Escherichia coli]